MRLELGDFCIRDWRQDDAAALARHADNPRVCRFLRDCFPHPFRLADAVLFLSQVTGQLPRTNFAIATAATEAIGGICLAFGNDVHRFTAELGYWLAEPYWNRGIMTMAVRAFGAYAFRNFELHRLFALPFATNPASIRVLEKAGFTREGVLRANVCKNGAVIDQYMYALILPGVSSRQRAAPAVSGWRPTDVPE